MVECGSEHVSQWRVGCPCPWHCVPGLWCYCCSGSLAALVLYLVYYAPCCRSVFDLLKVYLTQVYAVHSLVVGSVHSGLPVLGLVHVAEQVCPVHLLRMVLDQCSGITMHLCQCLMGSSTHAYLERSGRSKQAPDELTVQHN